MKNSTIYSLFHFWINIIILFFVFVSRLKVHQDLLLTSLSFQLFGKVKRFVFLDSLKISNKGSIIQLTITFCSQHTCVKLCYLFLLSTNHELQNFVNDRLTLLETKFFELFSNKCHKLILIIKEINSIL
jgi:hypothetical protein